MGNFSNLAITEKGRMLLADVQAGGELDALRLVMGSGDIPAGKTSATMTDVVYPVININIISKERTPDGKVIFGGYYSNSAVTEDFRFKEFALYARAIYRDDAGAIIRTSDEVLYCYGNAGSSADLIPAYTTGAVVEKQLEMVSYVGNETAVNLTVESGIYVGMREFEAHAERHFKGGADPISPADIGAATVAEAEEIEKKATDAYDLADTANMIAGAAKVQIQDHEANKNNPHGVTPSQIGAVNKNGDTVNGNLKVNGAFMVERSDNNRKARTVVHNNADKEADFQNYTDDSNYVGIRLATEVKGAGDVAKVVYMKDGQFASFPILHAGNKEKIFTFGTEDLEAGTSPLGTGQLHFVYE